MKTSLGDHLTIQFKPDVKPEPIVLTSIGARPAGQLDFRTECVRAAASISANTAGEKIALLLDESYESAVTFIAFSKAEVSFECYFIEFANLEAAVTDAFTQVEQMAKAAGIPTKRISFDFNNSEHLEGLEKLQSSTSCTNISDLFKIWAACHIDEYLVIPGSFVTPVFDHANKLKQWNLPGNSQLGLFRFFEEFGGIPFFFCYSPDLVYSQVDSELSNQLLSLTQGAHRTVNPEALDLKKKFAEQAFPSELAQLNLLESVEPHAKALRRCSGSVREWFFVLLKRMRVLSEPVVQQNIECRQAEIENIISQKLYRADLLALCERSDIKGNIFEMESPGSRDHKIYSAFSTMLTCSKYRGDTGKVLDFIKSCEFFTNEEVSTTNLGLQMLSPLSELMDFFKKSIALYFEEMCYDYDSFEITQCWANRSKKGQHYRFHYHPNSFLSGIFYLTSGGGGNTVFKSQDRPQIMPNVRRLKKWNTISCETVPEAGKLILFPSHVDHKTLPHANPDDARYVIAFNVMFTGWIS